MTNTLKEMPKVGDKVRYVGFSDNYLTRDNIYAVRSVDEECAEILNDLGETWNIDEDVNENFADYELVTEHHPGVHALIANLGVRLHEVEQYLVGEEVEQYPDDEEVSESTPEPEIRDAVNSPNHYTTGPVEVIDYIDQVADGYYGRQAVYAGNIIKYVSRAPCKNQAEDIRKAIWYAQRLADAMEAEASE